jgi:hypothetical protein
LLGITAPTIISTIPPIINGIIYCAYGVLSVLTNPNSCGVVITTAPATRPIIVTTIPMAIKIQFIFLLPSMFLPIPSQVYRYDLKTTKEQYKNNVIMERNERYAVCRLCSNVFPLSVT